MKTALMVIGLLASLALVVPVVHAAEGPRIEVVSDMSRASVEYDEFVGLFNSALIEGLKKADGQNFAEGHWGVFLFPAKQSKVRIVAIREGEGERPALVAVLKENASFISIHAVVERVIELVKHGGVE